MTADIGLGHVKGKLLSLTLLVLLLSLYISFLPSPNVNKSYAQETPVPLIYIDPPVIDDPSMVAGDTFTVNINIANVSETESLYAWQVYMSFNPSVLNTTLSAITEGTFLSDVFPTTFPRTPQMVNNTIGTVRMSCFFDFSQPGYPPPMGGVYDGWLASITFTVKATGLATPVRFLRGTQDTYLRTLVGGVPTEILNFKTADGGFDNRPVGVNVAPVASFLVKPLTPEPRGRVTFNASGSYDPDAWLTSYHWDFGDGLSDTYVRNVNLTVLPTHIYAQSGTYPVTLTVKDYDNATDTDSGTATVLFDVGVTAVSSPQIMVMAGTPVQINVTAVNNGDFLETFNVSVYANQYLIEERTVAFLAPKTQTIILFEWNTTGVSLGGYALKANTTVPGDLNLANNEHVDGFVTIASVNLVNYPVIVGGQTFIVQVNSTSSLGSLSLNSTAKKISLQVSGETGTTAFCNVTIPMRLLNVSSSSAWVVNFDLSPWNFTVNWNSTHYFIFLNYTHSDHTIGITGETVATPPIAQFTPSKTAALVNESITFDASASNDPDGTIQSWTWNFNDGNAGDGTIVQHSFISFNVYNVTLTVKDDENLTSSKTAAITIMDYPTANFTYTPKGPIANETLVTFDARVSQPNGGLIVSYSWDFGDGQTELSSNPMVWHTFVAIGPLTVNLTVTDSEDLSDSFNATILVTGYPKANFTFSPEEPYINQEVTFEASASEPNGGKITGYLWKFGDGQNSTGINATHSYVQEGIYTVQLSVTDSEHLTNTVGIEITVKSLKESSLSISATPTILTLGQTTTIKGELSPLLHGETMALMYKLETASTWNFLSNETTDASGRYLASWTPTSTGTYQIKTCWEGNSETQSCESQSELITVYAAEQQPIRQEPDSTPYAAAAIVIILLMAVATYFLKMRK